MQPSCSSLDRSQPLATRPIVTEDTRSETNSIGSRPTIGVYETTHSGQGSEHLQPRKVKERIDNQIQRTPTFKKWCRRIGSDTWTLEVLASLGSAACLGAIVTILALLQDKPLDMWRSAVSINAMVSTLTTAAKSLMLFSVTGCLGQLKWIYFRSKPRQLYHLELFDELGKGPLGAVQVLLRIRWATAYLGVFIVVAALAVDPFAQQVVELQPSDVVKDDQSVWFGVNSNYTASSRLAASTSGWIGTANMSSRQLWLLLNAISLPGYQATPSMLACKERSSVDSSGRVQHPCTAVHLIVRGAILLCLSASTASAAMLQSPPWLRRSAALSIRTKGGTGSAAT